MPHVLHACPAIKGSEKYPEFAKEFKTEEIAINTDAHKEFGPDGSDTGERHCPYCGASLKKAKAISGDMFAVLNGEKKLPRMSGAELLRAKYNITEEPPA